MGWAVRKARNMLDLEERRGCEHMESRIMS